MVPMDCCILRLSPVGCSTAESGSQREKLSLKTEKKRESGLTKARLFFILRNTFSSPWTSGRTKRNRPHLAFPRATPGFAERRKMCNTKLYQNNS